MSNFQNDVLMMAQILDIPAHWLPEQHQIGKEYVNAAQIIKKKKRQEIKSAVADNAKRLETIRQNNLAGYVAAPDEFQYTGINEMQLYANQLQFLKAFSGE